MILTVKNLFLKFGERIFVNAASKRKTLTEFNNNNNNNNNYNNNNNNNNYQDFVKYK